MFERYTEPARRVIFFARYEVTELGGKTIEAEHLLLGLLREDRALAGRFLPSSGAVDDIRAEIVADVGIPEKTSPYVDIPLSEECKNILRHALRDADELHHQQIGTEHLLLAVLEEEKSAAARILSARGLSPDSVREHLRRSGP